MKTRVCLSLLLIVSLSAGTAQALIWSDGFEPIPTQQDPNWVPWTPGWSGVEGAFIASLEGVTPHGGSWMITTGNALYGSSKYTNTFDTPFVGYTLTGYMALGATQPAVGSVAVIGVTPTSGNGCSARIKGDGTVEYHYGGLANAWDAPEPATVPVEEWIKVDIYGGPEGMIIFVNGQAFRNIYSGTGWDGGFDISSIWLGGGWGCAPAGYDTFSITPGLPDEAPIDCETAIVRGYGWDTDLNQDCSVDLLDYALFAQKWLMCIEPTDQNCQKPWE